MRDNQPSTKISSDTGAPRFPWSFVIRWLILIYGVLSVLSYSVSSYLIPENVPLLARLANPLIQLFFVIAAWFLLKRRKLAFPVFAVHFIASFGLVANGAPQLLTSPDFAAKWALSIGCLVFTAVLWRQGSLR
jgi:hypothetical protein